MTHYYILLFDRSQVQTIREAGSFNVALRIADLLERQYPNMYTDIYQHTNADDLTCHATFHHSPPLPQTLLKKMLQLANSRATTPTPRT
jgi:hypothetical protein